jgi:hypothetical protein
MAAIFIEIRKVFDLGIIGRHRGESARIVAARRQLLAQPQDQSTLIQELPIDFDRARLPTHDFKTGAQIERSRRHVIGDHRQMHLDDILEGARLGYDFLQ